MNKENKKGKKYGGGGPIRGEEEECQSTENLSSHNSIYQNLSRLSANTEKIIEQRRYTNQKKTLLAYYKKIQNRSFKKRQKEYCC